MSALRETVKGFLKKREYDSVLALVGHERKLIRTVVSLLYDGDELARWRAVTFMGRLALAEPGKVSSLVKRFIWWMNDESGGIGWSSAPAIGEIGRAAPELVPAAARVVIHYRQERFLFPGVIWATGRLAATFPEVAAEAVPDLIGFLADKEDAVRGQAALALGEIGGGAAKKALEQVLNDRSRVSLYENEELNVKEIGSAAAEALEKLSDGFHIKDRIIESS